MASNKLYVGGIPYRTTEDELRTTFEEAGTVTSVSIISDRMTGRSRGFGFVEMADEAQAQAASAVETVEVVTAAAIAAAAVAIAEATNSPLSKRPGTQCPWPFAFMSN